MAVATPQDSFDVSVGNRSPGYDGSSGIGIGWPSMSPKKSPSLYRASSRASSFAEKIFSRNRTKSTASSVYTRAESLSDYTPSLTPIIVPPMPPLPSDNMAPLSAGVANAPSTSPSGRLSWLSHSSTSTTSPSSPLILNKDVCDAFPSVPQQRPSGSSLHPQALPEAFIGASSSQPQLSSAFSLPIFDNMATQYPTRKSSMPSHQTYQTVR